jgi:hypothetical protein
MNFVVVSAVLRQVGLGAEPMESDREGDTHIADDRLSFYELAQIVRCANQADTLKLKRENRELRREIRRRRMAKADLRSPGCDDAA